MGKSKTGEATHAASQRVGREVRTLNFHRWLIEDVPPCAHVVKMEKERTK